jgi:hypothetical protein
MGYGEGCPGGRTACNPECKVLGSPEREERRSFMRGSRAILALAALAIVLGATMLYAQTPYGMPLERSINPVRTAVKYDANIYTFYCQNPYNVRFERIDARRVKLTVRPLDKVTPYEEISIQWGVFPILTLPIDGSGDNSFILNTETGYAEK